MNNEQRVLLDELRRMGSAAAADWLMTNYPRSGDHFGDAIILLPHLSWKRGEQLALARHYLRGLPFASERAYSAFLSFMSLERFLKVVDEYMPTERRKLGLLHYHLVSVLPKAAKSAADRELATAYLAKIAGVSN